MKAKTLALACAATAWQAPPALAAGPVSPGYAQLVVGGTMQFTAPGTVVWLVDGVVGGTAASGRISTDGVYQAPPAVPAFGAVAITAMVPGHPLEQATAMASVLAHAPTGRTYVVAPGGDDSGPGTKARPFATLAHAAAVSMAGDTVLARQGTYGELLAPSHSGDGAHGPVTFRSYPGETATIDGAGLPVPQHQWGLVTLDGISNVIVEGFTLRNYRTTNDINVPIGVYITGAGRGVQVLANHITGIVTTGPTTPHQCRSNALGLAVYGDKAPAAIRDLMIGGNELDHLKTGCSETLTVNGNVSHFAVVANNVHDTDNIGIDAIGYERVAPDPAYDQARDGLIRGNLVRAITSFGNPDYGNQYASDGIYVDGGTNIVIEQNIVHETDYGIELASEHEGHLTSRIIARNNLLYRNNASGITIGGYGAKRGGTAHCVVTNNTLVENDTKHTGSGEFQVQFNATDNLFADNIVVAGDQYLFVNDFTDSTPAPVRIDHVLYAGAAGPSGAKFVWQKQPVKGPAQFRAISGEDAHSQFADPLFRDAPAGDFGLRPGSPARGVGRVLPRGENGEADLEGKKRVSGSSVSEGAVQN